MPSTINASTSSGIVSTADTSGVLELQSNGTTKLTVASTGAYGQLVSGTAVASTSGTSIDFTGIPSWVKRITVMFNGVSTNGTSALIVQIGAGSVTTTGYVSGTTGGYSGNTISGAAFTTGFSTQNANVAANNNYATVTIANISGNTWYYTSVLCGITSQNANMVGGGSITLGGTLDQIRITTVNGTDTFDAGSINIQYEG